MAVLDLVPENDPILYNRVAETDFSEVDLDKVVEDLLDTMYAHKGVGLSANQVGLPYRIFVIQIPSQPEMVFMNPTITDYSGKPYFAYEGCLSFPNLAVKIKRPAEIRMRMSNVHGESGAHAFDGVAARIIQHEYDHLEGVDFTKRANRFHLEQATRRRKKLNKIKNSA